MDSPYGFPGYCDRLFDYNRLGAPLPGRFPDGRYSCRGFGRLFRTGHRKLRQPALGTWAVVLITVIILVTGSVTQIERANRVMMPVFFVLFTVLAVRVFFLPGASAGYNFLFVPKWERLLDVNTWVMAMGQAFFSLSITGSGMIVYGSYLNKKADIVGSSMRTALFDTVAALLSALAIMPAVFAFGIEPASRSFLNVYHDSEDFRPDADGPDICRHILPVRGFCRDYFFN